jgi:hypothetical protein
MGLLNGISAQAFTDNFLKTYMAIGEDERAKEATNIAQQMAQAKLEEIAREKEMLAKMQAESTGFMSNPVQDVIPAQGQQMTGNFANSGLPAIQGNPGLMSTPTTQNYASEFERIKANGGNPDQELFDRQARIGMMYDPKTFMPLVGRQQTAQDKMLNALLLNAANNETRRYGYDARSSDVSQTNDMRKVISENNNLTKEQIAKNHDLALKAIAALREKNGGKNTETDPYKQQTSDARAQQMAMRDLKAEGYTMDMVGNWTLDGQPVKSSMILPKYQALVRQYKVGNVREVAPSSSASSYIKGILKK